MDLKEWSKRYFTYRANAFGEEIGFKEIDGGLKVNQGKKEKKVIIKDSISEESLKSADIMVTLNDAENIKIVHKAWDIAVRNRYLKIIFVDIDRNLSWALIPSVHDRISDKKNLLQGLMSLCNNL